MKCLTNMIKLLTVSPQDSIRKCQQFPPTGHANIKFWIYQGLKIDIQASFASTLTEEPCMTGGSVKALVNGGHSSRHRFRLSSREIFVMLVILYKDTIHWEILNIFQFYVLMHLSRNQA